MRTLRHGSILAALALLLALCHATPTAAREGDWEVNPVLDVLLWRPVGLVFTGLGSVSWLIVSPLTLVQGVRWDQPGWNAEPASHSAKQLVLAPLYFTFTDPIGVHRCRDDIYRC